MDTPYNEHRIGDDIRNVLQNRENDFACETREKFVIKGILRYSFTIHNCTLQKSFVPCQDF